MRQLTKRLRERLDYGSRSPDDVIACEAILYQWAQDQQKFSPPELIDAMRTIERKGLLSNIFSLMPLALHPDSEVQKQCWRALERRMDNCGYHQLPTVSGAMRELRAGVGFGKINQSFPTTVLGLLSFNHNGYVRAAAVRELAKRFDGKELPYLVLAANDWVVSIHMHAKQALMERANAKYRFHILENISLVVKLWNAKRNYVDDLKAAIEKAFLETTDRNFLYQLLHTGDAEPRNYLFDLIASDPNNTEDFIMILVLDAFRHWDIALHQKAADLAFSRLSEEKVAVCMDHFMSSHLPKVRADALRWSIEMKAFKHRDFLRHCLFDRSGMVRQLAQFYSKGEDLTEIYSENLQKQTLDLEATLRALGELKLKVPNAALEPLLEHPKTKIRAAAYGLLFSYQPDNIHELLFRAFEDRSYRAAAEAFRFISTDRLVVSADELLELLNSHASIRVRRKALHSIYKLSKWNSLEFMLKAKSLAVEELQPKIDFYLADWSRRNNQSFVALSNEQYKDCMQSLQNVRALIPEHLSASIEAILKHGLKFCQKN